MTSVLVIAASMVVRAGLESILAARSGLTVAGSMAGPAGIEERIEDLNPDVILMDLTSTTVDSVEMPFALDLLAGGPPVVLLLPAAEPGAVSRALAHGARAILPREADGHEIVAAVEAAAAGLVVLDRAGAAALLPAAASLERATAEAVERLTPRETEVLVLLAEGAGNKQIARRLEISEHTVKFHVGSILAKLGASSRTEAVTLGVRHGLIMI